MDQITLHDNLPIIETADKLLLDTLMADPLIAHFILVRLSDTEAAVAPDKFDALLLRLRKIGHTPKVSEA
ncbi:MAG: hypothetical protein M1546_10370 [Chloroflexi bacterium]|nr:hypothetical protein [Chloroflexota bacterium]